MPPFRTITSLSFKHTPVLILHAFYKKQRTRKEFFSLILDDLLRISILCNKENNSYRICKKNECNINAEAKEKEEVEQIIQNSSWLNSSESES